MDWNFEGIISEYPFVRVADFSELPIGWINLFIEMVKELKPVLDKNGLADTFQFVQVKEKYGQLRCYTNHHNDEVYEIIRRYEEASAYVCLNCGKFATHTTKGHIAPICADCKEKYRQKNCYENNVENEGDEIKGILLTLGIHE